MEFRSFCNKYSKPLEFTFIIFNNKMIISFLEKIDLTNLLQLYFENQQLKKPKI